MNNINANPVEVDGDEAMHQCIICLNKYTGSECSKCGASYNPKISLMPPAQWKRYHNIFYFVYMFFRIVWLPFYVVPIAICGFRISRIGNMKRFVQYLSVSSLLPCSYISYMISHSVFSGTLVILLVPLGFLIFPELLSIVSRFDIALYDLTFCHLMNVLRSAINRIALAIIFQMAIIISIGIWVVVISKIIRT